MAPEVMELIGKESPPTWSGSALATASDMFSFGLIAFNVVTGLLPMANMTHDIRKQLFEAGEMPLLQWPRRKSAPYQVECEALCERCLAKDPESRATAKEIHACLLAWPAGGKALTQMESSPLADCSEELLLVDLESLRKAVKREVRHVSL